MGHVRAEEPAIRLARHANIVGVVPNARQKPNVLSALLARAYAMILRHSILPKNRQVRR